ncbi:ROK family transcriptional regulator [Actinomadura livida]|uniref:Putative NBD/HSP70 family sugar kinase n=1 Tax=Actinomadura livida TaxID=79909 RepID=A0A7W7N0B7_9ACTN|nr:MULTISPECIES: ROK family transcriptional regulator [Actinomadura]MBB4777831.1 putative NBD/HSP70 family sugar kinase [Actinomadura catellatispora]GGT98383.1 xylose repressor [Actinomadura livida]
MQPKTAHSARALRSQGALAVLRHVHAHPSATRAEVARALGLSSGSAAEITARLKAARLVRETPPPRASGRGRPSPVLGAHPEGPLVCVVAISHEEWRVACVELGGRVITEDSGRHAGSPGLVGTLAARVAALHAHYGGRVRAVSAGVAGTVSGTTIIQASGLGWRDVALGPLRPPGVPLLVGNDASLVGLADARRGAGTAARVVLHLTVEVGVGGILVVEGRPVDGATGAGGEFGHMPFGDPALECPCGARGCWDLAVDGRAMARALDRPPPADPRTAAGEIIASAASDPAALNAVAGAAHALGRGMGALVNALDPDAVTLSGLALDLDERTPAALRDGYTSALMRYRRAAPPPVLRSPLGPQGPLIGAADAAFDVLLTEEGLETWSRV